MCAYIYIYTDIRVSIHECVYIFLCLSLSLFLNLCVYRTEVLPTDVLPINVKIHEQRQDSLPSGTGNRPDAEELELRRAAAASWSAA